MNFTTTPIQTPPNAAPCLAVLTLGSDGPRHSALMSVGVDPSSNDRVDIGHTVRVVYWRAHVAVTSDALIITPLENPPNPLLDSQPVDASETPALPEHDTSTLSGKIAHLLHHDKCSAPAAPKPVTGFPAVIDGKPLAGITVPLANLDKSHLLVSTKPKDMWVEIPVASNDPLKQATLVFQFNDWLSGKADCEVLAHALEQAFAKAPAPAPAPAPVASAPQEPAESRSQAAIASGRDADGSTHPSGDAPYNENWKQAWHQG